MLKSYTAWVKYQHGVNKTPINVSVPFLIPKVLPPPKPNDLLSVMLAVSYSALMQQVLNNNQAIYVKSGGKYTIDTVYDLTKYEFVINDILSCGRKKGAYLITFTNHQM